LTGNRSEFAGNDQFAIGLQSQVQHPSACPPCRDFKCTIELAIRIQTRDVASDFAVHAVKQTTDDDLTVWSQGDCPHWAAKLRIERLINPA
jgi:hypothetical protein